MAGKKEVKPENAPKQGEKGFQKSHQKISEYEIDFMQILRSQRLSLREIARLTGVSKTTVRKYTENLRFPSGTDINISYVIRQLIIRTIIDAWRDNGKKGREYALTIEKYIGALKGIEDLRLNISLRDEILALENMMKEEELSSIILEALQQRYDKKNKELKG